MSGTRGPAPSRRARERTASLRQGLQGIALVAALAAVAAAAGWVLALVVSWVY